MGRALIATLAAIWLRVATALSEIVIGIVAQLIMGAALGSALLAADASWLKVSCWRWGDPADLPRWCRARCEKGGHQRGSVVSSRGGSHKACHANKKEADCAGRALPS
jgi:hypothetical protein